ncbi:hypothetical protein LB504_012465 [Fusarium proliferatum]|nr:hypothetical protein LB504_012465 [Fusarium proliferatum]
MVFYGRPSKDCAPCRKRKTRCDLVPTGCSQCRRAKITCHGYRTANELVFRDETRSTMQKVLASQRGSLLPSTPQWSPDMSARHAFLSLYTSTYSTDLASLQPLLEHAPPHGYLQVSVDAVGLAFMAFMLNRQDLIPLAYQRYLTAIRSLGTVVRSSMQANHNVDSQPLSDVTLQCVLLLDLYEKMAYQHHRSSKSPGLLLSHVHGALSIVQSRPRGEFLNPTIQRLATQSLFAFTLSCGAAEIHIPEALVRLYRELCSYIQSIPWSMIGLLIRLINLRADLREGKFDPINVVKRARDLYNELSHRENQMPRFLWPQRRDACETGAFDHYYDVYPSHQAVQIFNLNRFHRLDAAEIIQKFEPSTEIAENIAQMTQAICASVPAIISPTARSHNSIPFSPLQILECSALLSPLYAAARNTQDPAMRDWILQTLMYMANSGVKLAQSVAHVLMSEPLASQWAVFGIVGNYSVVGI